MCRVLVLTFCQCQKESFYDYLRVYCHPLLCGSYNDHFKCHPLQFGSRNGLRKACTRSVENVYPILAAVI